MSNTPSDEHTVSLRDHFSEQIRWVDKYFEKQLDNSRTAIDKAEQQLNKRLEGMNEFRDTLKDQASKLATKDEMLALFSGMEKRMQIVERVQSTGEGRSAVTALFWAIGASILSAVITAVIVMVITKSLK